MRGERARTRTEVSPARPMGARERGKLERRRRIESAAREVFLRAGYQGATLRAIAARAGVATGTLFLYARDKRDLLLMILNDDLDALTEASFAAADPAAPLLAQLEQIFRPRYEYWAVDPQLSLHALQEGLLLRVSDVDPRSETARYHERRLSLKTRIAALVRAEQRRGALRRDADADDVAWLFLTIYFAEVRMWLRERADVAFGLARFVRSLRIVLEGLAPAAPPPRRTER